MIFLHSIQWCLITKIGFVNNRFALLHLMFFLSTFHKLVV